MSSSKQDLLKRACKPDHRPEQQTVLITVYSFSWPAGKVSPTPLPLGQAAPTVTFPQINIAPTSCQLPAASRQDHLPRGADTVGCETTRTFIVDDSQGAKLSSQLSFKPSTCRAPVMKCLGSAFGQTNIEGSNTSVDARRLRLRTHGMSRALPRAQNPRETGSIHSCGDGSPISPTEGIRVDD